MAEVLRRDRPLHGEGVAGLIAHELDTVVSDGIDASDVIAEQAARQVDEPASRLEAREWDLGARAERLRNNEAHPATWQ